MDRGRDLIGAQGTPAGLLGEVLAALTDPGGRARFQGWRYTENGQVLPIGEGLWATADNLGPYRHDFLDADAGAAACFITMREGAARSILALRVAEGEIEAVVARPPLFGLPGPFGDGAPALDASTLDPRWSEAIAPALRQDRASLADAADAYFRGLERNDGHGHYPFADDCIRIENGFRTTGVPPSPTAGKTPYIEELRAMSARQQFETGFFRFVDRIRDRRHPVVDPARGAVFSFALFDHSGTVRSYDLADGTPRNGVDRPFTWLVAEGFRVEAGLITRIEAIMVEVPYGMRPGWPAAPA
ncbi:hypothetical protein [Tsuneonella sp. HG222]